jgi:hypothetical protein
MLLLDEEQAEGILNQLENLDIISLMVSTRDWGGEGMYDKWQLEWTLLG